MLMTLFLRTQFPYGDKLPTSNMPVSLFGQVPRDQREQELEYFINKQYNTLGLKIQNKLVNFEQQFSQNTTTNSAESADSSTQQNTRSTSNIKSADSVSSTRI